MYETVAYGWIFAVNIPKIAGRYLAAISVAEVIMKLIQLSSRGFATSRPRALLPRDLRR